MARKRLVFRRRTLRLHTATIEPQFGAATVLAADPWEYVQLALRREKAEAATFYWEQARGFFRASQELPATASPLTSYYCVLNATKALMAYRGSAVSDKHGARGEVTAKRIALRNEAVTICTGGVLPALSGILGVPIGADTEITLEDLLRLLPFVHRAFVLTFASAGELFLPLSDVHFELHPTTSECWFAATVDPKYATGQLANSLPAGWERDQGAGGNSFIVRRTSRFSWRSRQRAASMARLTNYHRQVRREILPIIAPNNRWYLRRRATPAAELPEPVIIFAALHRISELSRYNPLRLRSHLEARHNWLLTEFLSLAPAQFIHLISSEITGQEFLAPDTARL